MSQPQEFSNVRACVDALLERIPNDLRVGAPLGTGKPNYLLNEIYARAKAQPQLALTIYTALTLQRPAGKSLLEQRFYAPFADRVFGDYPDLTYELDRVAGRLPPNVRVIEFYLPPGKFVGNTRAQQDYISSNYTHVARDLEARGINVAVQQVAERTTNGVTKFSLSCNPDVAPDVIRSMRLRQRRGQAVAVVAQINNNLPYMFGDAEVDPGVFDFVVRDPSQEYRIFGPPKMPVSDADHMIGLYVSSLIKDGGELQVGIGAIGDAVVHGLLLRQQNNAAYRQVLQELNASRRFGEIIRTVGGDQPFEQGIFVASEMLIDGFLALMDAGVVKRKVYDDIYLQRLLNDGLISERIELGSLDALLKIGAIGNPWNAADVEYLRHWGLIDNRVAYNHMQVTLPDGSKHLADLTAPTFRAALEKSGLGRQLKNGALIHAGFFLGPQAFYQRLRDMPDEQRRLIQMRAVSRINDFFGSETIDRLHRRYARSVNTAMMVNLLGAATSDGLENGQVISGVGGQYNFVAQAHELEGGRSILNLRAVAERGGKLQSNIVFNYGHTTIPRHLRDMVVTEYGIADLRAKTDSECIQALLNITDSRFQEALADQAKRAGKLAADYIIPEVHRQNLPQAYADILKKYRSQAFAPFPLGCDFTAEELKIAKALKSLKRQSATTAGKVAMLVRAIASGSAGDDVAVYLQRMGLDRPQNAGEKFYARVLTAELRRLGL